MALKILVIEDDAGVRDTVCYILRDHGYEVAAAENGLDGLNMAHESQPDAILLDLMMPEMDGFELVEQLRQRQQFTSIPIVVLSAYGVPEEVVKLFNATGFVRKPATAQALLAEMQRVERVLQARSTTEHAAT